MRILLAEECGRLGNNVTSGWSVINAAGELSALAGLIAFGLLPVATIILAVPTDWKQPQQKPAAKTELDTRAQARRAALLLLMPALFTLILAAVLFALIGGELDCRRASVMAIPAAVLLGVGSLAMFVAVTWALRAYVEDHETVVAFASWVCAFLWAVTNTELWFTVVNSVHHLGRTSIYGIGWETNFTAGFGAGIVSLLVYAALLWRGKAGEGRVRPAATACLAALGLLFVTYEVAALRKADQWQLGALGWIVGVMGVSALAAVVAGAFLLHALPPRKRPVKRSG